jgi:hypothetical protein
MPLSLSGETFPNADSARGLSQRDFVAIHALQGLLAGVGNSKASPNDTAALAYQYADAMIKASTSVPVGVL